MKIALVRPLYKTNTYDPEINESLGLAAIAAYSRSLGHHVKIFDLMIHSVCEKYVVQKIMGFKPKIVGFSITSSGDISSAMLMRNLIRHNVAKVLPLFIIGGSYITKKSINTLIDDFKDTIFIEGEGENALYEILNKISIFDNLNKISKMKKYQKFLISSPPIDNLDTLPFPARDLAPLLIGLKISIPIQGSRGCSGSCTYCNMPFRNSWRGRSAENIVDEISYLVKSFGVHAFQFVDDDFVGPSESGYRRIEGIADKIIKEKLNIKFSVQLRPWSIEEKAIKKLAQSGCVYAFVGIENIDPSFFNRFNRKLPKKNPIDFIRYLRANNIEVQAGAIPYYDSTSISSLFQFYKFLHKNKLFNFRTATNRLQVKNYPAHHNLNRWNNEDFFFPRI